MTTDRRLNDSRAGCPANPKEDDLVAMARACRERGDSFFDANIGGRGIRLAASSAATHALLNADGRALSVVDIAPEHHRATFGSSVFNESGEIHRSIRRQITPAVASGAVLDTTRGPVRDLVDRHVARWIAQQAVPDVFTATLELADDFCAGVIVGLRGRTLVPQFVQLLHDFLQGLPLGSGTAATVSAASNLRAFLVSCEADPSSVLSRLRASSEDAAFVSHQMLAVLVASRDTLSALLFWALVDRATASERNAQDVVDEIARIYSPNVVSLRVVTNELEITGERFKPGDHVGYLPALEALTNTEMSAQLKEGAPPAKPPRVENSDVRGLGFGRGVRACPGRRLSELVVAEILRALSDRLVTVRVAGTNSVAYIRGMPVRVPTTPVRMHFESAL